MNRSPLVMNRSPLVAMLFLVLLVGSTSAQSEVAITRVTVVDVERGRLAPDRTVLLRSGRIAAVEPSDRARVAAGVRTLDGRGKFLIPGLLDMHVHLTGSGKATEIEMPLFIANGVTGVRVMSADRPSATPTETPGLAAHKAWQRDVEAGTLVGPRLLSLASWPVNGGAGMPSTMPPFYRASTREEGQQLARYFKERGFDFVKIYNNVSREGFFGLAEEAKRLGLGFAGHEPARLSALEISNAGQGSLEHSRVFLFNCFAGADSLQQGLLAISQTVLRRRMVDEYDPARCAELFRTFAKNRTYLTPTHGTRKMDAFAHDSAFRNDVRMKYVPATMQMGWQADASGMVAADPSPEGRRSYLDFYHRGRSLTNDAYRAGVPIMVGTDAGDSFVFPGSSMHSELDELVLAGLSPAEALKAATVGGAEYLGRTADLGTVERGRYADLVLLDADPLANIGNVRRIHAVVMNGRVFERTALDSMLARVEEAARPSPQLRLWAGAATGDTVAMAAGLAAGARIDSLDTQMSSSGRRALNYAAIGNRATAVRFLVARGASINLANRTGFTPLHHAVEASAMESLDALVEAGADLSLATTSGMTPLVMAQRREMPTAVARLQAGRRGTSTAAPQQGSPMALREEWEHQRRHILAVIDSATPAMLGFRPTPGVRTFAEQIDHIARVAAVITSRAVVGQPLPAGLDADTASYLHDHAKLRAQTDKFLSYVVAAVVEVPEAKFAEDATLFRMTFSRFRWNVTTLQHSTWTLGQLVPYLRLNGRIPPQFTPL